MTIRRLCRELGLQGWPDWLTLLLAPQPKRSKA